MSICARYVQVMLVLGDLAVAEEMLGTRLAVVGEVEHVQHVVFLLLDHLPAEVDNALQDESLVVLLPSVTDEDRVGLGKRLELEL